MMSEARVKTEIAVAALIRRCAVEAVPAMVVAGAESDLLAGELDIHEEEAADKTAHVHSWREYATWAGAAAAGLFALLILGRRLRAARNARLGGAA